MRIQDNEYRKGNCGWSALKLIRKASRKEISSIAYVLAQVWTLRFFDFVEFLWNFQQWRFIISCTLGLKFKKSYLHKILLFEQFPANTRSMFQFPYKF